MKVTGGTGVSHIFLQSMA